MRSQHFILWPLIALTACLGCKSKPADSVTALQTELRSTECIVAVPDVTPEDWPLTNREVEYLRGDLLKLDLKALDAIGLHKRAEIVAFAKRVLAADLAPIERDLVLISEGQLKGKAYYLLGFYGSLEDATRHILEVKSIVHREDPWTESPSDSTKHERMIRALGFYLMRDHFMPQKDRALMTEIEDYLLSCTVIDTPSCWPYPDLDNGNDNLRRYALKALAYGCSARAEERIKSYLGESERKLLRLEGEYDREEMEKIEKRGDEIRAKLVPVLPESELSKLESATGQP